ncbi:MAG: NmrA family NAD(P)-binding protein [Pseudomonadota bacterium]
MTFLILGTSGLQGGAVARELVQRGAKVRALTRNTRSQKARDLEALGIETVTGDLNVHSSLDHAFEGVAGLFSVQDFYAPGVGLLGEIEQARTTISLAKKHGVQHVVQSSMGDGHEMGGPAHFLSKARIEQDRKKSGLSWTLLGTVWFMDNLKNPAMKPHLMFPVLSGSLQAETPFHMLAVEDLGRAAADALLNRERWNAQKINLAGDVMTVPQMKAAYRAVKGRRPKAWSLPSWAFKRMVPEFAAQLAWHNDVNFAFGPEELRDMGHLPVGFADFLSRNEIAAM